MVGITFKADTSQVKALAARLRGSGIVVGDDMKRVVTEAARALAEDARNRAPHDSGKLAASIRHRVFWGMSAIVEAPALNTSGKPYAPFVEYGTSTHAPQPFLNPAADAEEGKFYASAYEAALKALAVVAA